MSMGPASFIDGLHELVFLLKFVEGVRESFGGLDIGRNAVSLVDAD